MFCAVANGDRRENKMYLKISEKGTITIPKYIREKYGLTSGVVLYLSDNGDKEIKLRPAGICSACGKPLKEEDLDRRACPGCTPDPSKAIKIY